MAVITYKEYQELIDALNDPTSDKIQFGDISELPSGGKFIKLKYNGQFITLQTKYLITPFGAKESQYEQQQPKKTIEFNLPRDTDVCNEKNTNDVAKFKFKEVLIAIQSRLENELLNLDRQREWLNIKKKSQEITKANMNMVSTDTLRNNDSDSKYEPHFRAKFPHRKGLPTYQIWDKEKNEIKAPPLCKTEENKNEYVSVDEIIPAGTEVMQRVSPTIWLINGKVGITYNIQVLRLGKRPDLRNKCIIDSDDDDSEQAPKVVNNMIESDESDDDDDDSD